MISLRTLFYLYPKSIFFGRIMIIIIPIGGEGKRFKIAGYTKPKALININGKPMIFYLLDYLEYCDKQSNKIVNICIPYNKEYVEYDFEKLLIDRYSDFSFIFHKLENNTRGAAETVNIMIRHLFLRIKNVGICPVLCMDSDNFYHDINVLEMWNRKNSIFVFKDKGSDPIYSYVDIDIDNGKCENIMEKNKISNYACSGIYGFDSINTLHRYSRRVIRKNIKEKGEFYMSIVMKQIIMDRKDVIPTILDKKYWTCVGTPLQLRLFCSNNVSKYEQNHLRICIHKYSLSTDDMLNYFKYIGNIGHEIYFDFFDRLCNSPCDNYDFCIIVPNKTKQPRQLITFQKDIGIYPQYFKTREFNKIQIRDECIIKMASHKHSFELKSEIHYYLNIPEKISSLFPKLFEYGEDGSKTWYSMEKIHGLSVSEIYLSELLTTRLLKKILDCILTIQSTTKTVFDEQREKNCGDKINIYENYVPKLKKRYNNYDYSTFIDSHTIYEKLKNGLKKYQNREGGKMTIIHGDPVFTNIILDHDEKLKFIDMKGNLGDELTIYGDWLYDWAKIYQSIIGYDEILCDRAINQKYKNQMKIYFEEYFLSHFSRNDMKNLKLIVNSLLFTLLPLHNNNKCEKYYNLINF